MSAVQFSGPGAPTVLIASLPAANVGSMAVCVGPPDSIVKGSATVLIGGKPAARLGDSTAHGGVITLGVPDGSDWGIDSEVRGSEVRGQRSEVRGQRSGGQEVRGQEVRGQRSRGQRSEVRGQRGAAQ